MCNLLGKIDEANGYFYDPQKVTNPKEMEIDYESIKDYFEHVSILMSNWVQEAIIDIEEKYLEGGNGDDDEPMSDQ